MCVSDIDGCLAVVVVGGCAKSGDQPLESEACERISALELVVGTALQYAALLES
jgi:hypothetical protein